MIQTLESVEENTSLETTDIESSQPVIESNEDEIKHLRTSKNVKSIMLKLRDQFSEEILFRVKRDVPIGKMLRTFVDQKGYAWEEVEFRLDQDRLKETDTSESLHLEDFDQIDAFLHVSGGGKAQRH